MFKNKEMVKNYVLSYNGILSSIQKLLWRNVLMWKNVHDLLST